MAKQLYGKNYADMSDKYRSKNTKQEFKDARREQRGDTMMNGLPQDNSKEGQRMAGDALEADTPVAAEASESVKNAAAKGKSKDTYQKGQQHYSKGELVDTGAPNKDYPGQDNNPYTVKKIENFDLAAGGAGSKKGTNRLSAQDMRRLREQGGFSRQEIVDYAENHDFGDGPGASGGKAQALLSQYKDAIAKNKAKDNEEAPEPVQETAPAPTPVAQETEGSAAIGDNSNAAGPQEAETAAGGGTQQNIQSGDGNISVNQQAIDNSRTYGGSTRFFNYQGSGDQATDTPVSAATMAGFYDVDDSPAANAARVDRQSDQNTQLQEKYSDTSGIAQGAIDNAAKNAYIDPAALDKRVSAGAQNMFDRSTLMGANIFGDMFAGKAPTWKSPNPPEKVETPDFSKLYDTYTSF